MSVKDVVPFKISIPEAELEVLDQKVTLTRLPSQLGEASWTEASSEGINVPLLRDIIAFWQTEYSWRDEEAQLNEALPQYSTRISLNDFQGFEGSVDVHFVHSRAKKPEATPLLFLHGWPGSFLEISKGLPLLNEAGFDIVAPSHAGFGFSSHPESSKLNLTQRAEAAHKLMMKLGYEKYFVQGGDWGAHIGRVLAQRYPSYVLGLHLNNIGNMQSEPKIDPAPTYSDFELHQIAECRNFNENGHAYALLQHSTPLALGVALHDSPVGLVAYILEKLLLWSDSYPRNPKGYKWQPREIITWVLLHYFAELGPTGGFAIYAEFEREEMEAGGVVGLNNYIEVKTGISAFWGEAEMVPKCWADTIASVVWYREQPLGGHFAMYEQPDVLVRDIIDFSRWILEDKDRVMHDTVR